MMLQSSDAKGEKICSICKEAKSLDKYIIRKSGKHIGRPVSSCTSCLVEKQRERKRKDPTIYDRIEWPSKLKRIYGITVEQYDDLLEKQNGRCAICRSNNSFGKNYVHKKNRSRFAVDHCHSTGRVRGLLCTRCNRALGLIGDDIESALRMVDYLKRYLS